MVNKQWEDIQQLSNYLGVILYAELRIPSHRTRQQRNTAVKKEKKKGGTAAEKKNRNAVTIPVNLLSCAVVGPCDGSKQSVCSNSAKAEAREEKDC